jgi:hypothetical protein
MPPPLPTSRKGRFFAWVLIAWGCLSFVTLVILLVGYLDREGILDFRTSGSTDYYYTADLEALHLPQWYGTNTIPLTPDHAVLAATRHLRTNCPRATLGAGRSSFQPQRGCVISSSTMRVRGVMQPFQGCAFSANLTQGSSQSRNPGLIDGIPLGFSPAIQRRRRHE